MGDALPVLLGGVHDILLCVSVKRVCGKLGYCDGSDIDCTVHEARIHVLIGHNDLRPVGGGCLATSILEEMSGGSDASRVGDYWASECIDCYFYSVG